MYFEEMRDFEAFTKLSQRCYPGMGLKSEEDLNNYKKHREKMAKEKGIRNIAVYEEEQLIGAYIEYDHTVNLYGEKLAAAGIGTVAVDLPYKKKGYAKEIIKKFLYEARENNQALTHLYPFQPAFYKRMGFGIGPSLYKFQFHPDQLPSFVDWLPVRVLGDVDKKQVQSCYQQWADQTHGATDIELYGFSFLEKEHIQTIGVSRDGRLEGYMSFEFKPGRHFLQNDLHVTSFFHTSREAYQTLVHHLHNQKDQVQSIHFPTFDRNFSFLLKDPKHVDDNLIYSIYHKVSEQGQGLMYRIIDIPLFLKSIKDHSFGMETVNIRWEIIDTLLDEKYDQVWKFTAGKPQETNEEAEVTIQLGIGEFSSLMMGCVTLESLLQAGGAEAEESELLTKALSLFRNPEEPRCWTFF